MMNLNQFRASLRKILQTANIWKKIGISTARSKSVEFYGWARTKIRSFMFWARANPLRATAYISLTGLGLICLLVLSIYAGAFGKLPSSRQLQEIKNPVASVIYGSNSEIIGHYYIQNRSNIDSSEINDYMKNALLATEDVRFYSHSGIDMRSLGRVLVKNLILQQRSSGGGSTLTQQLAKNVFGRKKRFFLSTPINKIREMIIAFRLEKIYSKDDILLLYLNTVSFGENIYGLEKAAHRFFNKVPSELDLLESATLVGVLKATTYYNPKNNPDHARRRRNVVLHQMYKYEFIDSTTVSGALAAPLVLDYQISKYTASFAAFFKDFLEKEFNNWAKQNPRKDGSTYNLHVDGLKIFTTLHPSIQRSAERAMESHMKNLQDYFNRGWGIQGRDRESEEEFVNRMALNLPQSKALARQGISEDSILSLCMNKKVRPMNTIDGYREMEISIIDSIIHDLTVLQSGILAIHSITGKILAYVGGVNYGYSQFDNVQIPRQVGSTFKPITYLAALESGIDPCAFFDNELVTYNQYEGWTPRNADGEYGGSYSMHGALTHSINTVSVQIMLNTGIQTVINLARKMGIESELPRVPSLVLGTADMSLMELATAYSSIANGGFRIHPYAINRIENEAGEILYSTGIAIESEHIANVENLEALRKMMEMVAKEGTGSRVSAYQIPYNIIGKTGTTQNNSDGWFVGCTPEIVIGAWVGTLDRRVHFKSTAMGAGANTSLPMVARTFKDLSLWRNSMISDFTYDISGFPCFDYIDFPADEAQNMIWLDSIPPTDAELRIESDTLLPAANVRDSLKIDSVLSTNSNR